jgi:hypothetical protein
LPLTPLPHLTAAGDVANCPKNGKLTQYPELAGQFIFSLIVLPALISLLLPLEAVATAFLASGMSRLSSEGCIFAAREVVV